MICIHCGGPGPCDCWKRRLTPSEREQAQDAIVARWIVKADRREFEQKQAEEKLLDQRGGNRGQFGIAKRRGRQKETVMKRIALVVLALLLGMGMAYAQPQVPSPTPATTFLGFDHDGVNTDGYKLKVDALAPVDVTATCTGTGAARTCTIPFPALTPGAHTLIVIAWNVAGEAASAPFAVTVVVIPVVPTNIRIVIR